MLRQRAMRLRGELPRLQCSSLDRDRLVLPRQMKPPSTTFTVALAAPVTGRAEMSADDRLGRERALSFKVDGIETRSTDAERE